MKDLKVSYEVRIELNPSSGRPARIIVKSDMGELMVPCNSSFEKAKSQAAKWVATDIETRLN